MKDDILARRRCTSCRRWFVPAPSAVQSQKVCGVECRLPLRNQAARRRRAEEIHEYRVDERARQASLRARRQKEGSTGEVSRASLRPQATQIERVALENWDKLARVSRASLRREIRMVLGRAAEIVGQEAAVA